MKHWDAVIFDLDDTLYAERDYVYSGFRAVATWGEPRWGIPSDRIYAGLVRMFENGTRQNTFDTWLSVNHLPSGRYVAEMVQIYRQHEPTLAPYPGTVELLGRISRHSRLGLLSDGTLAVQRRKLAALGIARYFEAVVFSDEWGQDAWKPSTRPFEAMMSRLAANPERSVYVADNPRKDFLGARRSGLTGIRLRHPDGLYRDEEPISVDHAPDQEVRDLASLERILFAKTPAMTTEIGNRSKHERFR